MSAAEDMDSRVRDVWAQLALVTDPELDEPVTDLGFIERVKVDETDRVDIDFRLPTYWCAANFAFLMADDMRVAVGALPWVKQVWPTLLDHMYADEVNAGVARGQSFKDTFGDLAADEPLDELRDKFRRKAFQRRQEAVLLALLEQGMSRRDLVEISVATFDRIVITVSDGAKQKARYQEILRDFGWANQPSERAFVTPYGEPLTLERFDSYLQDLRSVRINMEFNGALCRGLLKARYAGAGDDTREPSLSDFVHGRAPPVKSTPAV